MTASDGAWALHVIPKPGNEPLSWYSHHLAIKGNMTLGPYECLPGDTGRRQAGITPFPDAATVWLSNLGQDPYECHNVIDEHPDEARRLADALRRRLVEIGSPPEQLERLDFSFVHASTA
jgi:hypothetical protein